MQGNEIVMLLSGIFAGAGIGLIAGSWMGLRLASASADRALRALQIDSWNRKNAAPQSSNGRLPRSGQQSGRVNGHASKAAQAVMLDEHDD